MNASTRSIATASATAPRTLLCTLITSDIAASVGLSSPLRSSTNRMFARMFSNRNLRTGHVHESIMSYMQVAAKDRTKATSRSTHVQPSGSLHGGKSLTAAGRRSASMMLPIVSRSGGIGAHSWQPRPLRMCPSASAAHLYLTGAVLRSSASAGTDKAMMSSADGARTPLQQTSVHCLHAPQGALRQRSNSTAIKCLQLGNAWRLHAQELNPRCCFPSVSESLC